MARDRALLEAHRPGDQPVLRVYRWSPPALSLGYNQDPGVFDRAATDAAGLAVVRRPTGGRAILHADELTYAVVGTSPGPLFGDSLHAVYLAVNRALVAFLRERVASTLAGLLVTSRYRLGWVGERAQELGGLTPAEGARVFRQSAPVRQDEIPVGAAQALSERVFGHPLALVLGEEGEGPGTDLLGIQRGVLHAAGGADVGSYKFHSMFSLCCYSTGSRAVSTAAG